MVLSNIEIQGLDHLKRDYIQLGLGRRPTRGQSSLEFSSAYDYSLDTALDWHFRHPIRTETVPTEKGTLLPTALA
jgi:hypothetical protein